jgi:hypothetical protein
MGGKSTYPTRAFNITVNHRRRILSSTAGLPGRWNDKTVILFDGLLSKMHTGDLYADYEYDVYNLDGTVKRFRGAWVVVDNGYLKWTTTIAPMKTCASVEGLRWSRWLESMRKDVECTFGILKGRWRILKVGIRSSNLVHVDNIWRTCCALHNWLLEVDGLSVGWNKGVKTTYEGVDGCHENEDIHRTVPVIFRRINTVDRTRLVAPDNAYDCSGMGAGPKDIEWRIGSRNALTVDQYPNQIHYLRYEYFRDCLVDHFDYMYKNNKVVWPSRNGQMAMI